MTGSNGAINLFDVTITIQGGGADDGVNTSRSYSGTPLTIKVDKMTFEDSLNTADHSAGQQAVEFQRSKKRIQKATIETKLEKAATAALLGILKDNAVVKVIATAVGFGLTAEPALCTYKTSIDSPSTLTIDLMQYGKVWTVVNT